ncbi:MAG: hypothetical protein VX694_04215 [Planctomycetota bacterium]|nr:hypothetical protein [Planctomycetota bacterium]
MSAKTSKYLVGPAGVIFALLFFNSVLPLYRQKQEEDRILRRASEVTRKGQYYLGEQILLQGGDRSLAHDWFRESAGMRYVPAIKKLTLFDPENRGEDYLKWSLIDRHFEELKKARGKSGPASTVTNRSDSSNASVPNDTGWRLIREEVRRASQEQIDRAVWGYRKHRDSLEKGFFVLGDDSRLYEQRGKWFAWEKQRKIFLKIVEQEGKKVSPPNVLARLSEESSSQETSGSNPIWQRQAMPIGKGLTDGFEDSTLQPLWEPHIVLGLNVVEADGKVRIFGKSPKRGVKYVTAGFDLKTPFQVNSFTAEIDALAASGTFAGMKSRGRSFTFLAKGVDGNHVAIQYYEGRYRINWKTEGEVRYLYSDAIGDELVKFHRWKIQYDASRKVASVYVDEKQIGESVNLDLGDSMILGVDVWAKPYAEIDGTFDNFKLSSGT